MSELPDDFSQFERALASRSTPEPSSELRARVLGAVNHKLTLRVSFRSIRMRPWQFAATAAAVFFCVHNLSMSAANNTHWRFAVRDMPYDLRSAAAAIQSLLPEMTREEALRHALLAHAASLPAAPAPPHRFSGQMKLQEEAAWDLH